MLKRFLTATVAVVAMTGVACAAEMSKAPPGGDYQQVSKLVALPDFIPGLGTLYVQPATLPAGPFLAYDKDHRLVSSIYMIPIRDIANKAQFDDLAVGAENVASVDLYFNSGHPGVEAPHYHVVLWHVAKSEAKLQ